MRGRAGKTYVKLSVSDSLRELETFRFPGSSSKDYDLVDLGWDLRTCIFLKVST